MGLVDVYMYVQSQVPRPKIWCMSFSCLSVPSWVCGHDNYCDLVLRIYMRQLLVMCTRNGKTRLACASLFFFVEP